MQAIEIYPQQKSCEIKIENQIWLVDHSKKKKKKLGYNLKMLTVKLSFQIIFNLLHR